MLISEIQRVMEQYWTELQHIQLWFADDGVLFSDSMQLFKAILKALWKWCGVSHMKVNAIKTKVMGVNDPDFLAERKFKFKGMQFDILQEEEPFCLLGVGVATYWTPEIAYKYALKRWDDKVAYWRTRKLSLPATCVIINVVIAAVLTHVMMAVPIPAEVVKRLDKDIYKLLGGKVIISRGKEVNYYTSISKKKLEQHWKHGGCSLVNLQVKSDLMQARMWIQIAKYLTASTLEQREQQATPWLQLIVPDILEQFDEWEMPVTEAPWINIGTLVPQLDTVWAHPLQMFSKLNRRKRAFASVAEMLQLPLAYSNHFVHRGQVLQLPFKPDGGCYRLEDILKWTSSGPWDYRVIPKQYRNRTKLAVSAFAKRNRLKLFSQILGKRQRTEESQHTSSMVKKVQFCKGGPASTTAQLRPLSHLVPPNQRLIQHFNGKTGWPQLYQVGLPNRVRNYAFKLLHGQLRTLNRVGATNKTCGWCSRSTIEEGNTHILEGCIMCEFAHHWAQQCSQMTVLPWSVLLFSTQKLTKQSVLAIQVFWCIMECAWQYRNAQLVPTARAMHPEQAKHILSTHILQCEKQQYLDEEQWQQILQKFGHMLQSFKQA